MVGEFKKDRYIAQHYHCTKYRAKCPEPYTREEVIHWEFTRLERLGNQSRS